MKRILLAAFLGVAALAADEVILHVATVADAKIVHREQPAYPSPDIRVQGVVKLRLLIGKDGHVERVRLISGHPLLAPAAMQAARRWVFEPFERNGERVRATTEIEIPFTPPSK